MRRFGMAKIVYDNSYYKATILLVFISLWPFKRLKCCYEMRNECRCLFRLRYIPLYMAVIILYYEMDESVHARKH